MSSLSPASSPRRERARRIRPAESWTALLWEGRSQAVTTGHRSERVPDVRARRCSAYQLERTKHTHRLRRLSGSHRCNSASGGSDRPHGRVRTAAGRGAHPRPVVMCGDMGPGRRPQPQPPRARGAPPGAQTCRCRRLPCEYDGATRRHRSGSAVHAAKHISLTARYMQARVGGLESLVEST